ncbi:ras-related protein Rab-37-like [Sycon ciliatum]|uniref:ras-related protein Rab-37-like n=1 Tax=Sycon ciliatum TaxID=27933 RepID=UPI0031F6CD26
MSSTGEEIAATAEPGASALASQDGVQSNPADQLVEENESLQARLTTTNAELVHSSARLREVEHQLEEQEKIYSEAAADQQKDYIAQCDSLKADIASLTSQLTHLKNELSSAPVTDDNRPATPAGTNVTDGLQKIQRVFKVVLVGDSGVGKTTFIRHLCLGQEAANATSSTVGVDFYTKLMTVQGQCTSLKIWDTAGTERFRSITKSYFRDANGVLLVYDVTAVKSFSHVRQWMGDILENADDHVVVMVLGNKTDVVAERLEDDSVLTNHGRTLADSYRSLFAEVSAKTGAGIADAMAMMIRAMQDVEDEQIRRTRLAVDVDNEGKSGSRSCC